MPCPQCGDEKSEFREGVCVECCVSDQRELDRHNAEYDNWMALSEDQREAAIKRAARL